MMKDLKEILSVEAYCNLCDRKWRSDELHNELINIEVYTDTNEE